jgi:hypothetical protein
MLPIIQAFWHGPITTMERLSVASFLAHGHEVHVFTYGELDDLPGGTVICDAREVLPPMSRWRGPVYRDSRGSFSAYSNLFRYKLLYERGGWWVDLDTVCLQPFDFAEEYVFATEPDQTLAPGVLRVPAGTELMAWCYERCLAMGKDRRKWGNTGPRLFNEAVERFGMRAHAVPASVLIPIDWPDWAAFLDQEREWNFELETRALHLWNSLWAKNGRDRDGSYPPGCLYETLKQRYLAS